MYRPYQMTAISSAIMALDNPTPRPAVLVLATGAGKSHIIAGICKQLDEPTLILQPSKELLEQNHQKLLLNGITDIGIYSASMGSKDIGKYTMATIGSIVNCPELFRHIKYVLIDECDLVNPKDTQTMYAKFLKSIRCRRVIGLTATPYRHVQKFHFKDGKKVYTGTLKMINRIGYPSFWGNIILKVEASFLIQQKYLAPIEYHVGLLPANNLKLNSTGNDYTKDSLKKWGDDKPTKIAKLINSLMDKHQRILVFAATTSQSQKIKVQLEHIGVDADIVSAETLYKERAAIVAGFKQGDRRILINVGVFIAGLDVPELDCIVYARPTLSLRVWYQSVGRGMRIDPNNPAKVLHVYDLVAATHKLGRVETIKIIKEDDGFRDAVEAEGKRMDERPLFDFTIEPVEPKKPKKKTFGNIKK